MSNRTIIICFLVVITQLCYSQEMGIEEVKRMAIDVLNIQLAESNRINKRSLSGRQVKDVEIDNLNRNGIPYLYVVNAADSAGWVIIANEKRYQSSVVAYSETGSFSVADMPPAVEAFLQEHMDAIDSVKLYETAQTSSLYPVKKVYETPNMLEGFMWRQSVNNQENSICDKSYNKFCPQRPKDKQDVDCGRYVLGCGAVAMGLIMRYWHWPDYAVINGTTYYYDWDNMPAKIDNTTPMYQVDAVASLLRHCGIAAGSVYTASGTSATVHQIVPALQTKFAFSASYFTAYTWNDIVTKLTAELDTQRPVLCQAFDSTVTGHTFVIDGYRKVIMSNGNMDYLFHINFGWGWKPTDYAYFNINFKGYHYTRTFVTELYPTCSKREDNVALSKNMVVATDKSLNYYSGNTIVAGGNNNSVVVEDGGHMVLEAGKHIRLSPGFYAKVGSEVRLSIRSWCKDLSGYRANRRSAEQPNDGASLDTQDSEIFADVENPLYSTIDHYTVYGIGGQVVMYRPGDNLDISALPAGFYVVQTVWDDGSVASEKIVKQ